MNNKDETTQTVYITLDTKDSLVSSFKSFLVVALARQGIIAFISQDGLKPDIGKLSDFKLFLVIFSKDYALSKPCLDNLAKLIKFRCMNGHVMLVSVLYGVSLLSLKQQFCENIAMCSEDEISRWRNALEETTTLQSHEYNEQKCNEAEFVEEIARDVFQMLNPTKEIGVHMQQLHIENLLCNQQWGLRTIGISGKPGIGKTELANALFRRMSSCYDDSCLIKDFQRQYNSNRLKRLSDEYFTKIPMEMFDLNNSDSEPVSYRQKRVLIVLDDVRNALDAMYYLGLFNRFSPGSLVIITSREKQVLEECNMNEIYEVQGLNDEDALKLFTRTVFGNNDEIIEENLLDLSMKVVEMCEGNPSALMLNAQKLKGKNKLEIEHELSQICKYKCVKKTPICLFSNKENRGLVNEATNYIIVDRSVLRAAMCNVLYNNEEPPDFDLPDRVLESLLPSDHRVAELGHEPAVQALGQHLRRANSLVSYQVFSSPFSKALKTYSKILLRMRRPQIQSNESKYLHVLDISGYNRNTSFPEFVRAVKELNLEGIGIREIRELWNFCQELHFN